MSYARSAAFKSFQSRMADLHRVIKTATRLRMGGRRNQTYRDAMLSSTVLLSFAYFEGYVSDVTDDVCKALCSNGNDASRFPDALRTHVAVASRLKAWTEIQDPEKQRLQIWAYKRAGGMDILNDADVPVRIDVDALLSGVSYPKPKNVRKLLARLGVEAPADRLRERGGHTVEQKLTSIHDARAELAHTGKLPAWTSSDYEVRLRGLEEFAKALDKVLHKYVSTAVSSLKWIV